MFRINNICNIIFEFLKFGLGVNETLKDRTVHPLTPPFQQVTKQTSAFVIANIIDNDCTYHLVAAYKRFVFGYTSYCTGKQVGLFGNDRINLF